MLTAIHHHSVTCLHANMHMHRNKVMFVRLCICFDFFLQHWFRIEFRPASVVFTRLIIYGNVHISVNIQNLHIFVFAICTLILVNVTLLYFFFAALTFIFLLLSIHFPQTFLLLLFCRSIGILVFHLNSSIIKLPPFIVSVSLWPQKSCIVKSIR